MRSDLLFSLGYALLWIGLFAMARKGLSRHVVVGLFHVATVFVALISAFAYQYFKVTGSTLDSGFMLFSLSSPKGLVSVVASETSPGVLALIFVVLGYAFFGPWLITHAVEQGRLSGAHARLVETPWLHLIGVGFVARAACVLATARR